MQTPDSTTSTDEATNPALWHLVCRTRLGRVSILKNLDTQTARATYRSLKPDNHPVKYITPTKDDGFPEGQYLCLASGFSRTYGSSDDWLDTVSIIGPPGKTLDPWKGIKPRICDIRAQWLAAKEAGATHDDYGNPTGNPPKKGDPAVEKPITFDPRSWTGRR